MKASKAAVVVRGILGKIASIFGYFFLVITLFGFIDIAEQLASGDTEEIVSNISFTLFFLAVGVLLVVTGSRIKRRNRRFRRYVSLISAQNLTSIDSIAAATSLSVSFVRQDIQKMIDKKFFANASIDLANNRIVICKSVEPGQTFVSVQGQGAIEGEFEVFNCTGCGAAGTSRKGVHVNCEYCGSVIK